MDNDYSMTKNFDKELSEGMITETSNNRTLAGISKSLRKFRQFVVGLGEIYSVIAAGLQVIENSPEVRATIAGGLFTPANWLIDTGRNLDFGLDEQRTKFLPTVSSRPRSSR